MKTYHVKQRRCARLATVQSLYAWDLNGLTNNEALYQFLDFTAQEQPEFKIDIEYYKNLYYLTIADIEAIDALIEQFCDRPFKMIDDLDKAILRYSTFELLSKLDIDAPVIINEAIEIAKELGGTGSYTLVNYYLDTLNKQVRQTHDEAVLPLPIDKTISRTAFGSATTIDIVENIDHNPNDIDI